MEASRVLYRSIPSNPIRSNPSCFLLLSSAPPSPLRLSHWRILESAGQVPIQHLYLVHPSRRVSTIHGVFYALLPSRFTYSTGFLPYSLFRSCLHFCLVLVCLSILLFLYTLTSFLPLACVLFSFFLSFFLPYSLPSFLLTHYHPCLPSF